MITEISRSTLKEIHNAAFAAYARQYLDIYDRFLDQVQGLGLEAGLRRRPYQVPDKAQELGARGRQEGTARQGRVGAHLLG